MDNTTAPVQASHLVSLVQYQALQLDLDEFFLITMAMIVFFMQCGFAFLEAGAVRIKNTTNILFKNLMDAAIAGVVYYVFGYAFAFGESGNAFIGYSNFLLIDFPREKVAFYFFQYVFAATAATIVSGSVAERTELKAYFLYSVFLTGFVYPISCHWVWDSRGWIASKSPWDNVSYLDFAGSSVVHLVGGVAGLMGALALGPRIGHYNASNKRHERIRGHTIPLMALGGIILFFGFFAFNGGSQLTISQPGDGDVVAKCILNTILCGYCAGLTSVVIWKFQCYKFSLLQLINGTLTGMVAICAGCNVVEQWGAIVIGVVSGFLQYYISEGLLSWGIDDPLDAVAVHLGGGLWGIVAAPIFAKEVGILYNWDERSFQTLLWNCIGALVILLWSGSLTGLLFFGLKKFKHLRVSVEHEIRGLDVEEHGEAAYDPDTLVLFDEIEKIKKHVNLEQNTIAQLDAEIEAREAAKSSDNQLANPIASANPMSSAAAEHTEPEGKDNAVFTTEAL